MATDRAFLVTCASSGIGLASVSVGIARGALVYASVRKAKGSAALTRDFGARVQPIVFDIVNEAAVAAAAGEIARRQNGQQLIGIVNNAGASARGPLLAMSAAELRQQLEVNLVGVHHVTCAFAPLLGAEGAHRLSSGAPARIVMISSVGAKRVMPFISAYAASKFVLEGYSEGLRRVLMPFGIDVVVIGPGAVKTARWDKGLAFDRTRCANSIYGPILDKFSSAVGQQAAGGLPAEDAGKLIWKVMTMPAPNPRHAIVRDWFGGWVVPQVPPTCTFDRIIARRPGLERRA